MYLSIDHVAVTLHACFWGKGDILDLEHANAMIIETFLLLLFMIFKTQSFKIGED